VHLVGFYYKNFSLYRLKNHKTECNTGLTEDPSLLGCDAVSLGEYFWIVLSAFMFLGS
jgi:hypothetical protein